MTNDELERLADAYAAEYSTPPHFTVGYGVAYDQYLEMSEELYLHLREGFKRIMDFILRNHTLLNNEDIKTEYERLLKCYQQAADDCNEIDLDITFGQIVQMKALFGNDFFQKDEQS